MSRCIYLYDGICTNSWQPFMFCDRPDESFCDKCSYCQYKEYDPEELHER